MRLTPLEPWIQAKIGGGQGRLLRSDLETYQIERLRQTIRLAREKSRFYARLLADASEEISRLEDLASFPFTTPEDLRKEGQQFLCVSQGEIQRVVTLDTSGTTGNPKRVYFTHPDQELTIDFFHHGMSTFTGSGDRVMILLPHERPGSVGDLLATGLERFGAIPVRYGPVRNLQEALGVMQSDGIDVLVGAPVNVLALARFWETRKTARRVKPAQVLLSTDHVPQAIVNVLESIWGCTVYNHYGMTEMGLGGGVECQARRGYHLREADLYFEIVHPQTGQPVSEGETGEIIFTTLTRSGMPLIRYRTGDLSRFVPGQCPCGAVLRTLEKVTRRQSSKITFKDHSRLKTPSTASEPALYMADLDEALFPIPQLVNFSASLATWEGNGPGTKERLEVNLTVMPGTPGNIANQALSALDSIPAIQIARQARELDIWIRIQDFDAANAGSLAKRVITDRRGEKHARNLA